MNRIQGNIVKKLLLEKKAYLQTFRQIALLGALGLSTSLVFGAAGEPLPRCAAGSQSFYLAKHTPGSSSYPTTELSQIIINADNSLTSTTIWNGQGAPLLPPEDVAADGRTAGASVAMGMHPTNGYIYAIRAVDGDPLWPGFPGTWREIHNHYQVLKYGASGVDNLGIIQDMPPSTAGDTVLYPLGPNYNAADFNPATGELIIANFQTNGRLTQLVRVSVAGDVPTFQGVIPLSAAIPGGQSGDFAIDKTGTYAYGIARTSGVNPFSTTYRINLSSGNVESLGGIADVTESGWRYGAGATLQDGNMAFFATDTGAIRIMAAPGGAVSGTASLNTPASADAASCLPLQAVSSSDPVPVPLGGLPAGLGLLAVAWAALRKQRSVS